MATTGDLTDLKAEQARLWGEIQKATADSQKLDPDGTPSFEAVQAQKRLEKLNDDYRDILKIMATGTAARQPVSSAQFGIWGYDKDNNFVQMVPPNADDQMKTAIERRNQEMLILERERNFNQNGVWATPGEYQKMQLDERGQRVSEGQLQQRINEFNTTTRQKDEELRQRAGESTANIAFTQARTSQTGAETQLTQARIADLTAKTPAEIAEMEARGQLSRAQADQIRQNMGQPKVTDLGTGATYATMSPQGVITEQPRQGFVPKTMADIQMRQGQIEAAANAKKQQLMAKYPDPRDSDKVQSEFNAWYDQTVQPQIGVLNAAREQAQFERAKDQAEMQRQALLAAQNAGTQAIQAYNAQAPRTLGPGAAQGISSMINSINRAAKLPEQDYSWMVTQAPNLQQQAQEAVNRQLAAISPLAAQQAGMPQPNYGAVNPAEVLDRSRWAGAPAAAAAAQPDPNAGMQTTSFRTFPPADQQQINRAAAGFQNEAASNAAGGFGGYGGVFQGIGSNPMAAAIAARQQIAAQQAASQQALAATPPPVVRAAPRPAAPVPGPAPAPAPVVAPGFGYDPSAMAGRQDVPGFGYDPSNMVAGYGGTVPGLGYEVPYAAQQTNPFPGVQGLNVNGLNVNGLNLGGLVNGIPWPNWNAPTP